MQSWPGLEPFGRRVALPKPGLSLFVYELGAADAPAMLLIHGLGDEADTWRHVLQPLAARYHVVALDLPGFGRSDQPQRIYSLAFLRDSLVALLDALGISSAALMGNSLGAMLAQTIALEYPARVRELILVDGTLTTRAQKLNPVILQMALPFLGERLYNGFRGNPQAAYDSLRPYYAHLNALSEADRQFLYQRVNERVWSDGQRRAYLSVLRQLIVSAPLRQRNWETRLAQLKTPTQAVWGGMDRINSLESARALLSVQPTAQLAVIPGAGHLPHQEKPKEFLQAVGVLP